ncbi:MAG: DMT family transporter [Bacteroidales bacterium]|nr:DMT family transporter [Bacteroidales bacterium]
MAENRQLRNSLLLALTAAIWGVAFVAQSEGSQYMGSCTFTGLRFLIAAAALWIVIRITDRRNPRVKPGVTDRARPGTAPASRASRGLWQAGIICGVLLCIASLVQQEGIAQGTGAGKAGFITATYIVLVPILNWVVFRRRTGWVLWLGVAVGLGGLWFLCIDAAFTIQRSDLLVLLCAVAFSFQILAVDRFSPRYDAVKLSAIQFLSCGALASVLMVFRDIAPVGLKAWSATFASWNAWIPLLYAAILSSAVGYTLQIVGQKGLNPTLASLIMSTESLFAVLSGWLILHQRLTPREMLGAALMAVAIVLAQLAPSSPEA